MEPCTVMYEPEQATCFQRSVIQTIKRKLPYRTSLEETRMKDLNPHKDERGARTFGAPLQTTIRVKSEIPRSIVSDRARV